MTTVAHVINSSPAGMVGVEQRVLYLAAAQKARGASVLLMIDDPGMLSDACRDHGIPVIVWPGLSKGGGILEPPPDPVLHDLTTVLGLDDIVRFRGFRSGVPDHCPGTDILVMSSRSETGPQVVLEAMSRGMPIVATAVGEVTEMILDQRYGRIVPANSIMALAGALESMLADIAEGRFDPQLLIDRHRSGYTDEKMAERIDEVYQQVLAQAAL